VATNRLTPKRGSKAGMWSTIAAAVHAGWGATGRLLTVLAVLGVILIGVTAATGDSNIVVMFRALLAVSR
jgi:hypothetical protein